MPKITPQANPIEGHEECDHKSGIYHCDAC